MMAVALPWTEKYRPNDFFDIVSQNNILNGLQQSIENGNVQHLIFYGPSGSGKTTTILACARYMYNNNSIGMKLELNASDDRGICTIREQVKAFASSVQIMDNDDYKVKTKLVILDEADQLTADAQSALKKIIEQYTHNTRFCMICNNIDKIRKELKSRCMLYSFAPIPHDLHLNRLRYICDNEGLSVSDNGLKIIVNKGEGDMRKSINILQALYISLNNKNKEVSDRNILEEDEVLTLLGSPTLTNIKYICDLTVNKTIDMLETLLQIEQIKNNLNFSTGDLLKILTEYVITHLHKQNSTNILQKFGEIEVFMTASYNDKVITGLIIGVMKTLF